jgi:hypothetical protein
MNWVQPDGVFPMPQMTEAEALEYLHIDYWDLIGRERFLAHLVHLL